MIHSQIHQKFVLQLLKIVQVRVKIRFIGFKETISMFAKTLFFKLKLHKRCFDKTYFCTIISRIEFFSKKMHVTNTFLL